MADLGQTAYEAWQATDEYAPPTPSWAGLARRQQARWAAAEQASLGLGTLPAGEHEQAATTPSWRQGDRVTVHGTILEVSPRADTLIIELDADTPLIELDSGGLIAVSVAAVQSEAQT